MTKEEMMDKTDECIAELVHNKYKLQKAYNYYAGKRDKKQFEYLEKNFGIGNPTSVSFTPLVKKHIDALIGEFLGTPIIPKVSCKDTETISNITREKQLTIDNEMVKFLKSHLSNSLLSFINGKDITDKSIKEQLDKISSEKIADATEVMEYLTSVLRGEAKGQEIVVEGCGDGFSEAKTMMKAPSEKDKLKAFGEYLSECCEYMLAHGDPIQELNLGFIDKGW